MKSWIAAFVTVGLICAAAPSRADTLVVGGQRVPCPVPLESRDDEILAPLLPGLRHLGCKVEVSGAAATIVTPDGAKITLKRGSKTARLNGEAQTLAVAPKRVGDTWLVPAQGLAKLLGAYPRFNEETRTLYLHHRVIDVKIEPGPEGLRVRLACSGPLKYSTGALRRDGDRPPRIYLDVKHANLAGPKRSIEVNRGGVIAVRAAQYALDPDMVRVAMDLTRAADYRHYTRDDGRTIVLEVLIPSYEPAAVLGVEVGKWSERAAEIRVRAQGPLSARVRREADAKHLSFLLDNAIPPNPMPRVTGKHSLVQGVILSKGETADAPMRLELALDRRCAYAMSPLGDGLRIVVGALKLADVHVVLDPGHGGVYPGAQGEYLDEKEVNLDVGKRAAKLLRDAGARVTMTRDTDTTLVRIDTTNWDTRRAGLRPDLDARVALAKRVGADVFVSIHCNSSKRDNSRSGSSTYYSGTKNGPLAKTMQASLLKHLGLEDAGVHERGFVVCKYPSMPAALLELAFINNQREERLLANAKFRDRCAKAILEGLKTFVEGGALLESQILAAREAAPPLPPPEPPADQPAPPDLPDEPDDPEQALGPEGETE